MKDVVGTYISRFKNNRKAQVRLVIILAAVAVLVAGVVFWQLHYTGVAMANETYCGYEEHIHDESCYEKVLTCAIEEGTEEESTAAAEEAEEAETTEVEEETQTGHVHDDSCYEEILVCGMEEHIHTQDCMVDISADVETAADWEATLPESESGANAAGNMPVALADGESTNKQTIVLSDDAGLNVEISTVEIDQSGDDTLYTGETVNIEIKASNSSDKAYDGSTLRIYLQFDGDEYTFPYASGTEVTIHSDITDAEGNVTDIGIVMEVIYLENEDIWCLEVDGSYIVPGLTLDYILPIYYANGTAGGTMVVFTELVENSEGSDYSPSQEVEDYEKMVNTWVTAPGEFGITKTAVSGLTVSYGEGGYYITGLEYKVTPSITPNNVGGTSNSYGSDDVEFVSYDDVLVLDENTAWADGILEAVENGQYHYSLSISGSNYTYYLYVTVGEGDEVHDYLLCTITSSKSFAADVCPYIDGSGNLCIRWGNNNTSSNKSTSITPGSYTLTYGDEVIVITDDVNVSTDMVFNFENTAEATAQLAHSEAQTAEDTAESEVSPAPGSINVSKSNSKKTGYSSRNTMGDEYVFTVSAKNQGTLACTDFRYLEDELSDRMYIEPGDMQELFNSDTTHSLLISISPATICTPANTEDYTYNYGPETIDRTALDTEAVITITWVDPADNENSMLLLTLTMSDETTSTYTVGTGGDYASIDAALDGIGYVITKSVTYSLLWDFGEDYVLAGGASVSFEYGATLKNTFQYITADQDVAISSGDSISSSSQTVNTAYALNPDKESLNSARSTISNLYRDFTLEKSGSVYRDETVVTDDSVYPGDLIEYQVEVSLNGGAAYSGLPLEEQMSGGQVLLVPVSLNKDMVLPENLTLKDLEVVTFDGVEYYVLGQAGTYENVVFATDGANSSGSICYTAKVVVSESSSGKEETMIYSDIDIAGDSTSSYVADSLYYYTLVNAHGGDIDENVAFTLSNYVYLNDHETHRLYDYTSLAGTALYSEKNIVETLGETPAEDAMLKISTLYGGDYVTYRFDLNNYSLEGPVTLNGEKIFDMLPATVKSLPWTADRIIDISFVLGEDSYLCSAGGQPLSDGQAASAFKSWETQSAAGAEGSGWYITGEGTEYTLRWTGDLNLRFIGTVYVYVTVSFPEDEDWALLAEEYHNGGVTNTLYVCGVTDSVSHRLNLEVSTEAWLQKGVYDTGYYFWISNTNNSTAANSFRRTSSDSFFYYLNKVGLNNGNSSSSTDYTGYVEYYTAVWNEGDSNLYLNDIQDVLPAGFTLWGNASTNVVLRQPAYTTGITLKNDRGETASCVTFDVAFSTEMNNEGRQVVTFSLSNGSSSQTLKYSKNMGKYYLAPGEAAVITYFAVTDFSEYTDDAAKNVVAMPNYIEDYDGGGVEKYAGTVTATWSDSYGRTHNDGNCNLLESDEEAASLGMDVSDASDMWLSSDVTMYRGSIIPGITKTAGQAAASNSDVLDWKVTVYNDGTGIMQDYTITEVMQYPYTFTGDLTYTAYQGSKYTSTTAYSRSETMAQLTLTFGDRGTDSTGDYVEIKYRSSTSSSKTTKKFYYGEPETVKVYIGSLSDAYVNLTIEITEDEEGNEVLTLGFKGYISAILPGGYGVLTLQTKNTTGHEYNRTFYNTSYITPAQDYNEYEVTKGINVDGDSNTYVESDSVRATASTYVSYGHATTAQKAVTEVDLSGNLTDNTGYSDASSYEDTYILLSEEDSTFRYTLQITNGNIDDDSDYAINRLVIIDNLPEEGDCYTTSDVTERGSDFKVSLAENPAFVVTLDGAALTEGTDYRIEYSDKSGGFTTSDWAGSSSDGWYTEPKESTRSFRVIFLFTEDGGTVETIATGSIVTVSFNAVADAEYIEAGSIAWNSFGYQYTVTSSSSSSTAAPMEVGIQVPTAPMLEKDLCDLSEESTTADKDTTFTYIIYPGKAIASEWKDEESLAAALYEAGVEIYTRVTVVVPAGESKSDVLSLKGSGLTVYDTSTGEKEDVLWQWVDGASYTITELLDDDDEEYDFSNWNTMYKENSFTFTYSSGTTIMLTNVNQALNATGPQLPKAGGSGTWVYTIVGAALMAGALAGLMYRKKKRKGGRFNC